MGKNKNSDTRTRRQFLKGLVGTAAFTIVPRHVLGKGFTAPSDQLNIAVIGAGGKGYSDAINAYNGGANRIAAICDVDWHSARALFEQFPKAQRFKDHRVMFDTVRDIDAVTISTPDHTHAVLAMAAIKRGKHVYVQKPMAHNIAEVRALTEAARRNRVVTQMGNQGASGLGVKLMQWWFDAGRIGRVHKVEVWTDRPVWPQGIATPTERVAPIDGLAWDHWIGPAPAVDYHPSYHPFKWRGWWDYGTGALGDMGCHLIDPPFRVLGLDRVLAVESSVVSLYSRDWEPDYYPKSCPAASTTQYTFAATEKNPQPVELIWTDGGMRPFRPALIPADHPLGDNDSRNGAMLWGEKGVMTCGLYGMHPKLYLNSGEVIIADNSKLQSELPENGHQRAWTQACKAGFGSSAHRNLSASFDYAGRLTETVLLGNLGVRSYELRVTDGEHYRNPGRQKLLWDDAAMRVSNFEPANQFVAREYRKGWTL
ncbi:Oxidoreductase family, NAD-binding Rossmann fold [Microbulbifer donghaiensis]|uniref:Oxidoreductase family, NAD-binding Rossmann fold n=1 Tax=Microbulbifer donghaiensis TaxID=494016 RepID=A0A1M5I4D9_9GAMM|nr:Gfo/Idh/MocA family oxidoreductase [Microbulbifer donghaiensis]SHG22969.1 Oxidoreductase family, NAD-binding Rossmann fold [Microbulbifer donghaiensis]